MDFRLPMDLNPILVKDLDAGARRWRTYGVRLAYVLLLLIALWSAAGMPLTLRRMCSLSALAQIGHDLFQGFAIVQFLMITVYALFAAAEGLTSEVRADTLGLLTLTGLPPAQLIRGKWLAAVAQTLTLLLCGLPVLAATAFLGGPSVGQIVALTSVTLASALLAAAFATWSSSEGRGPVGAVVVGAIGYGCSMFLMFMLSALTAWLDPGFFRHYHPAFAFLDTLSDRGSLSGLTSGAVGLALTAIMLKLAAMRIAEPDACLVRSVQACAQIQARESYVANAMENLGLRRAHRPVWHRFPLLWKEIRTRPASRLSCELRLIAGILAGLFMVFSLTLDRYDQQKVFQVCFPVSILLVIAMGAGHFSRLREDRRWEALLGTPVSAPQIVAAKLLSGPASPEGITLIALSLLNLVHLWRFQEIRSLEASIAVGLFLAFVYFLSALVSILTRTWQSAVLLTSLMVVTLFLSVPLDRARPSDYLFLNPYALFSRRPFGTFEAFFLTYGGVTVLLGVAVLGVFRRVARRT